MKKTKIICTIGPACDNEKILKEMHEAGMNVARVNFSHGNDEQHEKVFNLIKKVREVNNLPLAIMLDTKGPEYRIKTFENDKIYLNKGDVFCFTTKDIIGNNSCVSVSYKNLVKELKIGDKILLNNGLLIFEVKKLERATAICEVLVGGELSNNKSMNFPGKTLKQKYLSEQDKHDLLLGIKCGIDFVACSFVSCAQDIKDIRAFLNKNGGEHIEIIAKIENQTGIDNVEEILKECSGIMVARGDLGVEIPQAKLPNVQKSLIKKSLSMGKIVITATEMLESMISNPRPTRAETSDVANAIYDGSSAIMLSGETAMGAYPVKAVETMSQIAEETESNINYSGRLEKIEVQKNSNLDAVALACCRLAIDTKAKAVVACSKTGRTIKQVARFHAPCDVLGLVTDKNEFFKLALYFGVKPMLVKDFKNLNTLFDNAKMLAEKSFVLNKGDNIIITGGTSSMTNTNLLKIEQID
ncbi:MAG: pyruvate kinase [Clostridia bacterium]|nr:pyruvate kinase [Clostridia bacterium]